MKDCIYFAYNSRESKPLGNLIIDEKPLFEINLFDYTGDMGTKYSKKDIYNLQGINPNGELWSRECKIFGKSTEGKGQIIFEIASIISHQKGYYVGIFDDDVLIRVSDINRALMIGKKKSFASFQPSLCASSYFSHPFTLNRHKRVVLPMLHKYRYVPWVEIMMPIIKSELLISSIPFLRNNISAYGLDCFVFPMLSIIYEISGGHAVIDASICTHLRKMRTGERVFSNGMDATREFEMVKKDCLDFLLNRGINWKKSKKLRVIFKDKNDKDNFPNLLKRKLIKNIKNFKKI